MLGSWNKVFITRIRNNKEFVLCVANEEADLLQYVNLELIDIIYKEIPKIENNHITKKFGTKYNDKWYNNTSYDEYNDTSYVEL